jgi:hypothetical protein
MEMDPQKSRRIESYENWSGARAVSDHGVAIKHAEVDCEAANRIADQEVSQIRSLCKSGVKRIVVSISDTRIQERIMSQLTTEEKALVSFGD